MIGCFSVLKQLLTVCYRCTIHTPLNKNDTSSDIFLGRMLGGMLICNLTIHARLRHIIQNPNQAQGVMPGNTFYFWILFSLDHSSFDILIIYCLLLVILLMELFCNPTFYCILI
jgi:hypothetical protein